MKLRHDQWCDLDEEGQCDCGIDEINASFARKDELLREAMYLIEESITFLKGEDMDYDSEEDLIARIRKEIE